MADEERVDLVESPVEADGAVFHDAAFGLEEEEVVEVCGGVGVAHVLTGERPLVEGGAPVKAAMGGLVVLALDPCPETAIECLEALGGLGVEAGEPGGANGSEPTLDFSLSSRGIGTGVDERDAELGAHQGELLGAVGLAPLSQNNLMGRPRRMSAFLNTGRNAVVFSECAKAAKGMARVASSMNAMR